MKFTHLFLMAILSITFAGCKINSNSKGKSSGYTEEHSSHQALIEKFAQSDTKDLDISDGPWTLLAYGYEDDMTRITPNQDVYIAIQLSDGSVTRISGDDGCNIYWGDLNATQNGWITENMMSTAIGCYSTILIKDSSTKAGALNELYSEQNQFFHDVISVVESYSIQDNLLTLSNPEGKILVLTHSERL